MNSKQLLNNGTTFKLTALLMYVKFFLIHRPDL